MKYLYTGLFLVGLSVTAVPGAIAFDGNRQGFVLGFGAGVGMTAPEFEFDPVWGLQTDLKLGVGVSNQTVIHYSGKQMWISDNGGFFTLANPVVGVTYYLNDDSPSAFLTGGAGLAIAAAIYQDEVGGSAGLGAFVGMGYEIRQHWNVEFNVIHDRFSRDTYLWTYSLTLNLLGY